MNMAVLVAVHSKKGELSLKLESLIDAREQVQLPAFGRERLHSWLLSANGLTQTGYYSAHILLIIYTVTFT